MCGGGAGCLWAREGYAMSALRLFHNIEGLANETVKRKLRAPAPQRRGPPCSPPFGITKLRRGAGERGVAGEASSALPPEEETSEVTELANTMAETGSLPQTVRKAAGAAGRGDEAALLAWIDGGGRVNDATCVVDDVSGVTVLMLAAEEGHERVVKLLIRRGAEFNLQDSIGGTALMLAAGQGHERVVELLLQRGARSTCRAATASPR